MLTNILTDILPSQAIVYDTLLISVFGGMINGFAVSLCLMDNIDYSIRKFKSEKKLNNSLNQQRQSRYSARIYTTCPHKSLNI